MAYGQVDAVDYKVEVKWSDESVLDITKYLVTHSSEEGLTIENNKISLQFKLIKDTPLDDGTLAPFTANNYGENRLKTDCLLNVYVKYADTEDWTTQDILKTYYVRENIFTNQVTI